jgi:hypothetical protein
LVFLFVLSIVRSCFVKWVSKTAPALLKELFMELKPKKKASLLRWSHTKRSIYVNIVYWQPWSSDLFSLFVECDAA